MSFGRVGRGSGSWTGSVCGSCSFFIRMLHPDGLPLCEGGEPGAVVLFHPHVRAGIASNAWSSL
jgi:hypothetical protein